MDYLPRVLTVAGAARLGITEARIRTELRRGRWHRLAAGVLLTRPDKPTRDDWINAGMSLGGPSAVLSGWDAVRLRGLGESRPPVPTVLVLTAHGRRNRVVGGVHLRPTRRPVCSTELSALDERLPLVRIANPARAVADTALLYRTFRPVRALVTAAAQQGLCTPEELRNELATGPRNASAFLHRALQDVFGGAASIAEAELADLMRRAGLPGFELNVSILDHTGRLVATADVLWRTLRAVLEVDSRKHHFLEPQWDGTMKRHNKLTRHTLAVTHYPPKDLRARPTEIARELEAWLRARAAELGVRYPPPTPPTRRPPLPYVLPPPPAPPVHP